MTIDVPGAGARRLATLGPGMSFGEAALFDEDRRTADVRADTDVACLALSVEAFEGLMRDRPAIAAVLLRNLLRSVGDTAGRLTREVAFLAG